MLKRAVKHDNPNFLEYTFFLLFQFAQFKCLNLRFSDIPLLVIYTEP